MTRSFIQGTKLFAALVLATVACGAPSTHPSGGETAGAAQQVREDADEIPCEPRLVLQSVCQQCHSLPPRAGAPFPLVRRSDVLAIRSGIVVRKLMIQQLEAKRMPLTPVTIAPNAEAVLLAWLSAGAPAMAPSPCLHDPTDGGDDAPSDGSLLADAKDGCADASDAGAPDGTDADTDAEPE